MAFDTVVFRCPKCDGRVGKQSKDGGCEYRDIDSDEVPVDIARGICGEPVWCETCAKTWTVVALDPITAVRMRLA